MLFVLHAIYSTQEKEYKENSSLYQQESDAFEEKGAAGGLK